MARTIVVNWEGEVSEFGLSRVQREKIYGKKKKVVVDENGEECTSAALTRDGSALLPGGSMASVYLNENFEVCERKDLVMVDEEGAAMESIESTLGVEQPLEGPIDPARVLDHLTKAVYQLDPAEVSAKLEAALKDGDIFETRFAYRSGFSDSPAFLLHNDEGFFALIGEEAGFDYLRPDEAPVAEDDDTDDPFEDDDLDFSMF